MKLSNKAQDFGFLTSEFDGVRFELFTSDESFLSCVVCWFQSSIQVVAYWQELQSIVSVKFKPEGRYSKWNTYLVLLCSDRLDIRDKYVIQNDRYAARKIVLDGLGELPDINLVEKMVNVELLGSDLELKVMTDNVKEGVEVPLASLVKGAPLDATSTAKEERSAMIDKLIEFLEKNENQKS